MAWFSAAFLGVVGGFFVFAIVWSILVAYFVKTEADKETPAWPVVWAMAVAYMVIALSFAGYLRDVLPAPDEYDQEP